MARIQTLFATAAIGALLLGLLASQYNLSFGLIVSSRRTAYGVPNTMLCYGAALFFSFFAMLYSLYMVPWSAQAARWHFTLSVLLAGVLCTASFAAVRFNAFQAGSRAAMPVLIAFSLSPILFLLLQVLFLLDGVRRAWPVLRG